VLGAVERAGNALYRARVYLEFSKWKAPYRGVKRAVTNQRRVLLEHINNIQHAARELSKMLPDATLTVSPSTVLLIVPPERTSSSAV
jgi:hypothetical protein